MPKRIGGYVATPKLEHELARTGEASLEGGRYRATVAKAARENYKAWTDAQPFVYGRPATTLQGALDALEELVVEAERTT
jgi:hypothetical protein